MTNEFRCEPCKYQGTNKGNYNRHLRSTLHKKRAGLIETKNHQCPHCEYKSNRKQNLATHVKRKHDPNHQTRHVFECRLCDRSFRDKFNLVVHLKSVLHKRRKLIAFVRRKKELGLMDVGAKVQPGYEEKINQIWREVCSQVKICDKPAPAKAQASATGMVQASSAGSTPKVHLSLKNIDNYETPSNDPEQCLEDINKGLSFLRQQNQMDVLRKPFLEQMEKRDDMSLEELQEMQNELFETIRYDVLEVS